MDSLEMILTKAYTIVDEAGVQPSPETAAIRCLLITPEHIRAFKGKDLLDPDGFDDLCRRFRAFHEPVGFSLR